VSEKREVTSRAALLGQEQSTVIRFFTAKLSEIRLTNFDMPRCKTYKIRGV